MMSPEPIVRPETMLASTGTPSAEIAASPRKIERGMLSERIARERASGMNRPMKTKSDAMLTAIEIRILSMPSMISSPLLYITRASSPSLAMPEVTEASSSHSASTFVAPPE